MVDAVAEYHRVGRYGFTPPGHRQGRGVDGRTAEVLGRATFHSDMLASSGADDRKSSNGYLKSAEALMAEAVGADTAFFSTCGSSLSVKAAMLAVAGGKGQLLLSRDAHKSVTAGLIFAGVEPVWIAPRYDAGLHLAHPPSPDAVERAWGEHPDAAGALVVSPSPYGTCADIEAIAEVCHRRGKPLIIDEAWGAHLPWHRQLPTWAMDAGADVCVTSVHKMGAGLEQGSVFHVQGDLIDRSHLSACADLLMTTSPNVLIYAAIDGWRRHMVQDGERLYELTLALARRVRTEINDIPGLDVQEDVLIGEEASHDLDLTQVLVDTTATGMTGYQVADWLRSEHRIDVGMSDHRRFLITLSLADTDDTVLPLLSALAQLPSAALGMQRSRPVDPPSLEQLSLEMAMLPREAFFAAAESVAVEQAPGRIAAEQVTPYPPGIPVIVPGERVTKEVLDYLRRGLDAGMVLPDPADQSLATLRVVVA
jgi:arginine decarboxylase